MEMTLASFILFSLLLFQFSIGSNAREINKRYVRNDHTYCVEHEEDHDGHHCLDPRLSMFFRVDDLYLGKKMRIRFAANDNSTRLLTQEEADSIPFSSSKLAYIFQLLSISYNSQQAKNMASTLEFCELEAEKGEVKFCATSLESLLDKTNGIFNNAKPNVLTTKILNANHTLFQMYTFVKKPLEIHAPEMVVCHTMAYPYMVYYCHGTKGPSKRLYKIALDGENGERVDAVAVCHMDTSTWDRDHAAFRALGGLPRSYPVCHFLPADNLAWIPST
ncbi:BURP domain-containing protein [Tanacetum coccineum]